MNRKVIQHKRFAVFWWVKSWKLDFLWFNWKLFFISKSNSWNNFYFYIFRSDLFLKHFKYFLKICFDIIQAKGPSMYYVIKILDFLTPLPFVITCSTERNQKLPLLWLRNTWMFPKCKFEMYNGVRKCILDELIYGKKVKVYSKSMYQYENSYLTGSL